MPYLGSLLTHETISKNERSAEKNTIMASVASPASRKGGTKQILGLAITR
jgi:hypothetical protein